MLKHKPVLLLVWALVVTGLGAFHSGSALADVSCPGASGEDGSSNLVRRVTFQHLNGNDSCGATTVTQSFYDNPSGSAHFFSIYLPGDNPITGNMNPVKVHARNRQGDELNVVQIICAEAAIGGIGSTVGTIELDAGKFCELYVFFGNNGNVIMSFTGATLSRTGEVYVITAGVIRGGFAGGTALSDREINIERPANTTIDDGGTDAQGSQTAGVQQILSYTIQNEGVAADLTVSAISSTAASNVTVDRITPSTSLSAAIAPGGTMTFDVAYTPTVAGDFSFELDIVSDDADEANYDITVSGTAVSTDTDAPVVTIDAPESFAGDTPFTATFTFNEDVTGFDAATDVTVTNGAASDFQVVTANRVFTVTITPTGAGDVTITVPAGAAEDAAGNENAETSKVVKNDIVERTSRIIRNFIAGRMDVIVSNDPDTHERLSGGGGGGEGNPVGFAAQGEEGNYTLSFHTSLRALHAEANRKRTESLAEIKRGLALAGEDVPVDRDERLGFDIWAKGKYVHVRNASRRSDVGLLYLGTDYRFSSDLVAGVLTQMDWTDERDRSAGSTASGFGWLTGPYVVARLHQNLIFDGRAALGTSNNKVSPLGTYRDKFDTTRLLIRGQLTGDFQVQEVIFNPFVQVMYFTEKQHGYTDSLGNRIPRQTLSLGRVKFGPKVSTTIQTQSGAVISPHLTFSGLYDFDRARQTNAQGLTVNSSRIRGRVEGGIGLSLPDGVQLNGEGFYDGIGAGKLESYGGSLSVRVPLN